MFVIDSQSDKFLMEAQSSVMILRPGDAYEFEVLITPLYGTIKETVLLSDV